MQKVKKILFCIMVLGSSLAMSIGVFAGTLRFDTRGGTYVPASTTMTEPATTSFKSGYVLDGWEDDNGDAVTFDNSPVGGTETVHAVWRAATYSLTLPSTITMNANAPGSMAFTANPSIKAVTNGLNDHATVSVNAKIGQFENANDSRVKSGTSANIRWAEDIGYNGNEYLNYGKQINNTFAYPGSYDADVEYQIGYKEPVNLSFDVTVKDEEGNTLPEQSDIDAISSVTGNLYAYPGEEIDLTIKFNKGYDNPSFSLGTSGGITATTTGGYSTGVTSSFKVRIPDTAAGTFPVNIGVTSHFVSYTVIYSLQNIAGTAYEPTDSVVYQALAGGSVYQTEYARNYDGFTVVPKADSYSVGTGGGSVECRYNRNSYTLTYDTNKNATKSDSLTSPSVSPTSSSVKYEKTLNGYLPTPVWTGYHFDGWYTAATGGTQKEATDTMPHEDLTLYAHWTPYTVAITFNSNNGGTAPAGQTYTYDASGSLPGKGSMSKTGYTFAGWAETSSGVKKWNSDETRSDAFGYANSANATQTLYAVWTPNTTTFTYNTKGGSSQGNTTHTFGTNSTLASAPTKNGYDFSGWSLSDGGSKAHDAGASSSTAFGYANTENATKQLYALWSPHSYSITCNYDSGSATNQTSYTIESAAITLNNPTRANYTFTGWSGTGLNGNNNMTVTIPAGSTGNREYTAHWQATGASVTVYVNWDWYNSIQIGSTTYTQSNFGGNQKTITIPGGTTIVAQGSQGDGYWYYVGSGGFGYGNVARCTVPSGASGAGSLYFYDSYDGDYNYIIGRSGACASWSFSVN